MKYLLAKLVLKLARGHHATKAPRRHRLAGWVFRNFPGQITCAEFEDYLMDYHEGDLPAPQVELFERHMKLCGRCQASLAGYVKSIELGQKLFESRDAPLPEEVPDHIISAVMDAMKAR